jgi:Mg-chelatase subunit ChlD
MDHRNSTKAFVLRIGGLVALIGLGVAACSATSGHSGGDSGQLSNGNHAGSSAVHDGPQLALGGSGTSGSSANLGDDRVCKADTHDGQRVPLDMYFVVDSSLSMDEDIQGGGTRWDAVSTALIDFLDEPTNAGNALGLGYFPIVPQTTCKMGDPNCFCILTFCVSLSFDLASCEVADYAASTVPLTLPTNPLALISDLQSHLLNGGTPTRPALEGAVQYVTSWAATHPGRKTVVVLATDGEPSGCANNTPQDVANVAAAALAGPAAIQTFVIGVGSSLQSLNLVAQAGGTKQAYLVEDANAATAFAVALEQIRGAASPCDFLIPTNGAQGKVDPTRVNVKLTTPGSAMSTLIAQTADGSAATCGADGGWHYDNPLAPTAIKLCPASCEALNNATVAVERASVQVEFGCETVTQEPK